MLNYFDDWKAQKFRCEECGWQGTGDQADFGVYATFMDLLCPRNEWHMTLAIVPFPTTEEMLAHQHIPWVREQLERQGIP